MPIQLESIFHSHSASNECRNTVVTLDLPTKEVEKKDSLKKPKLEWYVGTRRPNVNLQWKNLSLRLKQGKKTLLENLSGEVAPGELVAILGPSGAGKTSLLNVLSGFRVNGVSGQILVNGIERDMHMFKKLSCYVMQENGVHPHITIKEAITMAASLKIASSIPADERNLAVQKCIEYFRLKDKENTRGKFLSGGERKLLCIAQEIVSNPSMIFLDEPTSGLDISSCLQLMRLLKNLAKEGRTIVCSIHQPSAKIFEMFDKIYLMSEGKCIYHGQTSRMVPYFAEHEIFCPTQYNPADFAIEIALKQYGDYIDKLHEIALSLGNVYEKKCSFSTDGTFSKEIIKIDSKRSRSSNDRDEIPNSSTSTSSTYLGHSNFTLAEPPLRRSSVFKKNFLIQADNKHQEYATSAMTQFRILTYRSFLNLIREPLSTYLRLGGCLLLALLVGTLFPRAGSDGNMALTNEGLVFFTIVLVSYLILMPTLLAFPLERNIIYREYLNNWYSLKIFYFARTLSEIPFQLALSLLYSTVHYWMTSQPKEIDRFLHFLLNVILLSLVVQVQGFALGGFFSLHNAVFLGPFLMLPPAMFCGYLITVKAMPVYFRWMSYFSYLRWVMENITFTLYSWNRGSLDCSQDSCLFTEPEDVLNYFAMDQVNVYVNYAVQIVLILIFWIIGYFILAYRAKHKI